MCAYSDSLEKMISNSIKKQLAAYSTGDVAAILNISVNMVIVLCDEWTPDNKKGLECYRAGTHRRIPHHSIVEWLEYNSQYNSLGENNEKA